MKFEPKQGDMVLVGQHKCLAREFVAMDGQLYLCRGEGGGGYVQWDAAKPLLPKPDPAAYTRKTWPQHAVWLRETDPPGNELMVIGLDSLGVCTFAEQITWGELACDYEMSLDHGQTWKPCHQPTPTLRSE